VLPPENDNHTEEYSSIYMDTCGMFDLERMVFYSAGALKEKTKIVFYSPAEQGKAKE